MNLPKQTHWPIYWVILFSLGVSAGFMAGSMHGGIKQASPTDAECPRTPSHDNNKTLFSLVTKLDMGDKYGRVELLNAGIFVHPGETIPTRVSFKLGGRYHKLNVYPFIAPLPASADNLPEAGTVGVEFLLDGKSAGKSAVNRDINRIVLLDLSNVDILTLVVDNGDGKSVFDWLTLNIVELQ